MVHDSVALFIKNIGCAFSDDVANGKHVEKEDVKCFIVNLLCACDEDEVEWIKNKLLEQF